jgi:hypothetical protein
MYELTKDELIGVNGGAISLGIGCLIVAGIVFIIGVIDGYTRPLKCN